MITNNLTSKLQHLDRVGFIRLLIAMANSDGNFSEEERQYINALQQSMNLTVEETAIINNDILHPKKINEIALMIKDPVVKRVVFREAVFLTLLDGFLSEKEKLDLNILSESLGINSENSRKIINWCKDFNSIQSEGLKLMGLI